MVSRAGRRRTGDRFPLDTGYPQGFTNPVWVIAGDQPVRDRASADYRSDGLTSFSSLPRRGRGGGHRKRRTMCTGQFDEARQVYQRLGSEDRR